MSRARLLMLLAGLALACRDEAPPPPAEVRSQPVVTPGPETVDLAADPQLGRGRWREFRTHRFDDGLTDAQREEIAQLEVLGYADGVREVPGATGVTRHDPQRSWPGVNLYTAAHRAEAFLIDMDGAVLHRWRREFREIWPDHPDRGRFKTFWRRVHLLPDGGLLAIFEGVGLVRIDRDSKVVWASTLRAHHDLEVTDDGRVHVLTREAHLVPEVSETRPVLEDFVTVLDLASGVELRRISVLRAMLDSDFSAWIDLRLAGDAKIGDVLHTNTVRLLDGSFASAHPAFAAGRYLISFFTVDGLAVLDPESRSIAWARKGSFRRQHDPRTLANGRLLLFDNQGGPGGRSRLLELDPATGEIGWDYVGNARAPFYSETCGAVQPLPNANLLVTESDNGRAFEITRGGEIVWEFVNPHRGGPNREFIATLMELERLPESATRAWLRAP